MCVCVGGGGIRVIRNADAELYFGPISIIKPNINLHNNGFEISDLKSFNIKL